jgi:hypothetical protein
MVPEGVYTRHISYTIFIRVSPQEPLFVFQRLCFCKKYYRTVRAIMYSIHFLLFVTGNAERNYGHWSLFSFSDTLTQPRKCCLLFTVGLASHLIDLNETLYV